MTGSGNPRSAMHVDPHVVLIGHSRFARMQAHAHSDWPVAQRIARRRCRRQRVGRLRERHEERVSLCLHLDTAVARELFAQRVMVTGQQVRVLVAPLLQQPRRALDVGEQERDGPTRERHV